MSDYEGECLCFFQVFFFSYHMFSLKQGSRVTVLLFIVHMEYTCIFILNVLSIYVCKLLSINEKDI